MGAIHLPREGWRDQPCLSPRRESEEPRQRRRGFLHLAEIIETEGKIEIMSFERLHYLLKFVFA